MAKKKGLIILGFLFLLVSAEFVARFKLGLGTPPLFIKHPSVEFMLKPDQEVYRFGNHFIVNHYSMRSENFSPKKADPKELRIMAFGDSVLNGGSLTDHSQLATTILQSDLEKQLGSKVFVGNISAGNWAPRNWLAYANEFGFFNADIIIVVLSSHDALNEPVMATLNPNTHPENPPFSALSEGISRYLPRYFPKWLANQESNPVVVKPNHKEGLKDLKLFLELALKSTNKVFVAINPTIKETQTGIMEDGFQDIVGLLTDMQISYITMQPIFHEASLKQNLYRNEDKIHPNNEGQELIAEIIENNIPQEWLKSKNVLEIR